MSSPNPALYGIYFGLGGTDLERVRTADQDEQEKAIFALVNLLESAAFFKGAASMKRRSAEQAFFRKSDADAGEEIEKAIRALPIRETGDDL